MVQQAENSVYQPLHKRPAKQNQQDKCHGNPVCQNPETDQELKRQRQSHEIRKLKQPHTHAVSQRHQLIHGRNRQQRERASRRAHPVADHVVQLHGLAACG